MQTKMARIPTELHRRAAEFASERGISLGEALLRMIETEVNARETSQVNDSETVVQEGVSTTLATVSPDHLDRMLEALEGAQLDFHQTLAKHGARVLSAVAGVAASQHHLATRLGVSPLEDKAVFAQAMKRALAKHGAESEAAYVVPALEAARSQGTQENEALDVAFAEVAA